MSAPKPRALHFGLAGHPTDPTITPASIQALVTAGADKARRAGYTVQLTFVDHTDWPSAFDHLARELETGNWDALIIGGGIKMAPMFLGEFEKTVNLSREVAPKTRILFQGAPGDIFETLERGFAGE